MPRTAVDFNTNGDNVVITNAGDNRAIGIIEMRLYPSASVGIKLRSKPTAGGQTDMTGVMSGTNPIEVDPVTNPVQGNLYPLATKINESLNINLNGGVQVGGYIFWEYFVPTS